MEILDAELTAEWLDPTQISWVGNVVSEESEGGKVEPVSRQARPLFQATFATFDAEAVQTMFFNTDCGRKAFFIRPPVERFYLFENVALGTATGLEQEFQLEVTIGSVSWDALYVDNVTLYANGVAISDADWEEDEGLVTLEPSSTRGGQAIEATYQIKYAVRIVDPQLDQQIVTADFQTIQTLTVREIF